MTKFAQNIALAIVVLVLFAGRISAQGIDVPMEFEQQDTTLRALLEDWDDSKNQDWEAVNTADSLNEFDWATFVEEQNKLEAKEAKVDLHEFNRDEWEKLSEQLDYSPVKKEITADKKDSKEFNYAWLQTLAIVIVITVLVLLIILLLSGGIYSKDKKTGQNSAISIEELDEKLHESDLDRFLREALESGQYKLAVRILYLMLIKDLSNRDFISWKKDKPNSHYLREMRETPHSETFRKLTLLFEEVWYGEKSVNKAEFDQIEPFFRHFLNSIAKPKS